MRNHYVFCTAMPAKRIASDGQLEILMAFMEQNPDVANSKAANSATRQHLAEVWADLTKCLNAESTGGCIKTQRQWRDYWNDKKYSVNQKRIIARRQRRAASSGIPTPLPKLILFTEWEARMAKILTSSQSGQCRVTEPIEEILTSVKEIPNMIQETEQGKVYVPYGEANSNSESNALQTENVKIEMVSFSPTPASSPEASSPISSMFTAKTAAGKTTRRRVSCRVKRPYHCSVATVEEIRLAVEDKILAKKERRLAEKERRMAAEDRRLAAEDRQLAIEERKIAVQERRLAEEMRRKVSENKITRALQSMSQKITRLSAEFDARPP